MPWQHVIVGELGISFRIVFRNMCGEYWFIVFSTMFDVITCKSFYVSFIIWKDKNENNNSDLFSCPWYISTMCHVSSFQDIQHLLHPQSYMICCFHVEILSDKKHFNSINLSKNELILALENRLYAFCFVNVVRGMS